MNRSQSRQNSFVHLVHAYTFSPGATLRAQAKHFGVEGSCSLKWSRGRRWWYERAKWGDGTSVRPQIGQSDGRSHTFERHRGQKYPPLVHF